MKLRDYQWIQLAAEHHQTTGRVLWGTDGCSGLCDIVTLVPTMFNVLVSFVEREEREEHASPLPNLLGPQLAPLTPYICIGLQLGSVLSAGLYGKRMAASRISAGERERRRSPIGLLPTQREALTSQTL